MAYCFFDVQPLPEMNANLLYNVSSGTNFSKILANKQKYIFQENKKIHSKCRLKMCAKYSGLSMLIVYSSVFSTQGNLSFNKELQTHQWGLLNTYHQHTKIYIQG